MSDDNTLQQAVLAELSWEPRLRYVQIGVRANGGIVTLTGRVRSFEEKRAAEAAASRVKGVKAIAEEIEVRLPPDMERADDEIAAAALESLAWDVHVPKDKIKVKVEKGWVTLTGDVNWHFQKDAAEGNVRRLFGVVGVSNHIAIKSFVRPSDVHEKIKAALLRSWYDRAKITVSSVGSKVILDGNVHTWHERQLAREAAWGAPGVTQIEDNIVII